MSGRGVLLLAHGTPENLDQMEEYLTLVRGGRRPSPELVMEMKRRYETIGGRSPLAEITFMQAAALRTTIGAGIPVYVGMRCWRPTIIDAVRQASDDGMDDLLAIPMAPQYSTFMLNEYDAEVRRAAARRPRVRFVDSWHDHPLLIQAFAERVREARAGAPEQIVIFSAHSLPERVIREGDPYVQRVHATVRGVSSYAGLRNYEIAFQSAGRSPEPWLGPTIEERLAALARDGARGALVVPVGFLCDHAEILYDIDVEAREKAARLGIALRRTTSLNDSETLVRALADLVSRNA